MDTDYLVVTGYAFQTLAYALLSIVFFAQRKSSPFAIGLSFASALSSLAGAILALRSVTVVSSTSIIVVAEWARYLSWIVAFLVILRVLDGRRLAEKALYRYGLVLFSASFVALGLYGSARLGSRSVALMVSGGVLAGLFLISLAEQVFRNITSDSTSGLKYVCVAVFVLSGYDIVQYLYALSEGMINSNSVAARGYVYTLGAVPLALFARRNEFDPSADVARQATLYRSSFLATGIFILLWLIVDAYVQAGSASWSTVATIVIAAAVLVATGIFLVSASIRARARVFLTKAFFRYKYDYRREWLRFIATLSESGLENVPTTAVRAVAQIVNSPGGIVWVREHESKLYAPIGSWRCDIPSISPIRNDSELVRFLVDQKWVIDLEEKQRYPARYGSLELDPFFQENGDWWLIVPLFLGKRLFGFIWLRRPRLVRSLNFEDHDLLRTVGRHVGMHINQAESDKRLAESSQFGTYNRLTAFLMHDLNNLIAQQSLVVTNAERYRENPEFVDDAIATIANSVSRMRRLMEQLTRSFKTPERVRTDLNDALLDAVDRCSALRPEPVLVLDNTSTIVLADLERLTNVFEHLIRNAQDATPDTGRVEVSLQVSDGSARVSINDTGSGMSPEFIRERLFRPFDSTKGSHAMGIGVYQAREYARMLGGQLEVVSKVGQGTTFMVNLPVAS